MRAVRCFVVVPVLALVFLGMPLTHGSGTIPAPVEEEGSPAAAEWTWFVETVENCGGECWDTSMALDGSDHAHISYYVYSPFSDLRYAHYDGIAWTVETVDSFGDVGEYSDLALDSLGRPHIAYSYHTVHSLRHAFHNGVSWITETVDFSTGMVGERSSIAIDTADRPHISYRRGNGGLHYAFYDGSTWLTETVDTLGSGTSIALNSANQPRISYLKTDSNDLNFAYFDGVSWFTETVDSTGTVGYFTSLALDTDGNPHISYCEYNLVFQICTALKYAHFDGVSWKIETVDSAGDVGRDTSLVLDADDRPHISYYDETDGDLLYAYYDGDSWQIETVDSTGDVGKESSLALDSTGKPHISYHNSSSNILTYASACVRSDFTWIPTLPTIGEIVTFTSAATGTTPITYTWNFGDSNTGAGQVITHTYAAAGLYTVTLTATNACGFDVAVHPIEVVSGCVAVGGADFAWYPPSPIADEVITFTGSITMGTSPITFTWAFGDGNTGAGQVVTHTYAAPGTYTATMTATNACEQDIVSKTVEVVGCAPVGGADFAWDPISPVANEVITFTGSITVGTSPITYTWDFGDGGTATGQVVTHAYTAAGLYTATVTATNACGLDSASHAIEVEAGCEAIMGVDSSFSPPLPTIYQSIVFSGSVVTGTPPISYTWYFGDGSTAASQVVSHTYATAGDYTALLTATNACSTAVTSRTVSVSNWLLYLPLVVHQHDAYEPDDTWEQASPILPGEVQLHDIDPLGDGDWMVFLATYGYTYEILVYDTGVNLDSYLDLFDRDGVTLIAENDTCADPQYASCLSFAPDPGASGNYFIRVSDYAWQGGPDGYAYSIRLEEHP